jgi:transposase
VRKQKTDRQDAQLLLRLMLENRFPASGCRTPRIVISGNCYGIGIDWCRWRTRVMNQLHVVPLNEGLRRKKALWRPAGRKELESIALAPWASRRRQDLLDLRDQLTPKIQELTHALEEEVEKRPVTRLLMTHPGVGPLTALAYELVIGTPDRFHCGKQLASYIGLVPTEESSGDRRRLGHISKQGNVLLRFLLVEAAQVTVRSQPQWHSKFAVRSQPQWHSKFFHLAMRRGRKIAKVAMARKLAVHLYWMWRQGLDYGQFEKLGSHAGEPGNRHGVQ